MKTNTAIKVGATIAIIGFVGYTIYDLPATPQVEARETTPAPVRQRPPAQPASQQAPRRTELGAVPHWVFSEHLDTFEGTTTKGASVQSMSKADLGDLYGFQHGTLIIGSEEGKSFAGFTVGAGHIIGDYIEAKGDDGIIERFPTLDMYSGDLDTVLIKDFDRFYALVSRNLVVTIRATFYRVGERDFTFDVTE